MMIEIPADSTVSLSNLLKKDLTKVSKSTEVKLLYDTAIEADPYGTILRFDIAIKGYQKVPLPYWTNRRVIRDA